MEQPQPVALEDPHSAAAGLLHDMLGESGAVASAELIGLFGQAVRDLWTASERPGPVTSVGLLLAMVSRGAALSGGDAEQQALIAVSVALRRNPAAHEQLRAALGASEEAAIKAEPPPGLLRLSRPLARSLYAALDRAGTEATGTATEVRVTHLLAGFPPEGSLAARILEEHGLAPEALAPAAAGPPTGGEEEPASDPHNERVSTHADEPADVDELGRRAFADILADRIREARESSLGPDPSAFIVHLHGPWGSGKTSVLNFVERNLCAGPEPWIVVKFNAWRDQRLQPPWWTLITTIYAGAAAKLTPWPRLLLRLRWLRWRLRADYLPVIAVAFGAALMLLLWLRLAVHTGGSGTGTAPGGTSGASVIDMLLKYATPILTLLGGLWMGSRTLALGSRRAAQTYAELKDDPYKPITRLFNRLVRRIGRPVVVFIDDLDRCDSKYVVELLEGIQTLMRSAPVTYVVAADRKWICSSFEQRYAGFSPPIGECGRPLGYLFLDKVFQISAASPQIPADVQSSYWARLLSPARVDLEARAEDRRRKEAEAERAVAGLTRSEDLQARVRAAEESGDEVMIQAMRAATAKRIASPDAALHTQHRLQAFAALLEPNPRSMKRLVNAYAMHQATLLLAGQAIGAGPLARWTILEMRWPLLADFLAQRPDCLDDLARPLHEGDLPQVPPGLRPLFGDELLAEVIGDADDEDRLTGAALRTILGAVQGDR
ncbi:KAP family P-loop NTPase fold protein [Sphingomonas parva]|uniref:KAP family P-loop NTPase fold protein n=1 Tax=Sphingomonas parva TaxID=2555898 RepID=UPI001431B0B0|nr:P-loop NTPase fold protein [Sphingomonas parva]